MSALALLTAVSNQAIQLGQSLLRHSRAIQLSLRGLWRGGSMAGKHRHVSVDCPTRSRVGEIGIHSNKRKMARATSLVRSFIRSLILSFVHFMDGENRQTTGNSFIHSFIHLFHIVWFTYPFIRSFIHSFIHCIRSLHS